MFPASRTGTIIASAIAAFGPIFAAAQVCVDHTLQYNNYDSTKQFGAQDIAGEDCAGYQGSQKVCGDFDAPPDFIANEMCCFCGGGSTSQISRSIAVNKAHVFIAMSGEDCPGDFRKIFTLSACQASMDMISKSGSHWDGAWPDENWPKGCYIDPDFNKVVFNTLGVGSSSAAQLICQKDYDPVSVQILFVGGSDIDLWDSSPFFPGSFNVGIAGYTTSDVIKEVDIWVEELGPKWVVLAIGDNDNIATDGTFRERRTATKESIVRFKTIVSKFVADGSHVIYMGNKPEPGAADKVIYREYKYYDKQIRKFARSLAEDTSGTTDTDPPAQASPPLQMVDVYVSFNKRNGLYNSDKLHMSRLGYHFWNGWVQLAMTSKDPCIRWRDGVCMEAMDGTSSADNLRR